MFGPFSYMDVEGWILKVTTMNRLEPRGLWDVDLQTNALNPLGGESYQQRCLVKIKHPAGTPQHCQEPENLLPWSHLKS